MPKTHSQNLFTVQGSLSTVQGSLSTMAFMIDKALFEGDGPVRNYDATKAKHDAFFSSSQFSRPYYRTKHGGSDG